MANYITIDGGTTNTRISLVQNGTMTDTLKFGVGARAGMEEEGLLQATVKQGIQELLTKNGIEAKDITRILASGMITPEFGLYQLDHATAPVGIAFVGKRSNRLKTKACHKHAEPKGAL